MKNHSPVALIVFLLSFLTGCAMTVKNVQKDSSYTEKITNTAINFTQENEIAHHMEIHTKGYKFMPGEIDERTKRMLTASAGAMVRSIRQPISDRLTDKLREMNVTVTTDKAATVKLNIDTIALWTVCMYSTTNCSHTVDLRVYLYDTVSAKNVWHGDFQLVAGWKNENKEKREVEFVKKLIDALVKSDLLPKKKKGDAAT